MQIEFTQLIEPEALTTSLSILIISLFVIIAYLGFRLRSAAVLLFWAFTVTVLMLTILINLSFIWFWIMIVLTVIVISIASMYSYVIQPTFT